MHCHSVIMERLVMEMYENFFEMERTPFSRNLPADRLYKSAQIDDAIGRLKYAADRQLFAVPPFLGRRVAQSPLSPAAIRG